MANRTTGTLVRELFGAKEFKASLNQSQVDAILLPFITTANSLVTRACSNAKQADGTSAYYTSDDLELIERWLAAHFYCVNANRATSERAGSVGASYSITTALNLASSMYGQTALVLDANGGLAALSKQAEEGTTNRIGVAYLGSNCDATSEADGV
jgi:hypothetical protein